MELLNLDTYFTNPFVLMFLALMTGLLLGKVSFLGLRFGISGALFTGIVFGYLAYRLFGYEMGKEFFYWNLIFFVAAVGLLAAKDIGVVMKRYGLKFIMMGIVITFVGAAVTLIMTCFNPNIDPFLVSGVYTGALTSSPGLGAAIEAVSMFGSTAEANVGIGHAIGYPFGVLIVIFAVQVFPRLFGINLQEEKEKLKSEMKSNQDSKDEREAGFDLLAFGTALLIGYLVGKINIPIPVIGHLSLGSTGGVLIVSLFLGYKGKVCHLNFRMNERILTALQQISLAFFLAIVGIRSGPGMVQLLSSGTVGFYLIIVALAAGILALMSGFILGRFVFKINWVLLAGALCGGMTSTPGLGAAIDATNDSRVAAGYGATYPMALFCMVLFTILLHHLCSV